MITNNFIRTHLIKKIGELYLHKRESIGGHNFLYLDNEYNHPGGYKIDRIGNSLLYSKDTIWPLSWGNISSSNLISIHNDLVDNKFFSYWEKNGRSHKIRLKRRLKG